MKRVLIIGGYGNFGRYISGKLAQNSDIQLIVAGRSISRAAQLASSLGAEAVELDINRDAAQVLGRIQADIVIHTSGPFQGQSYDIARACIAVGAHYIDLADGRDFVAGISTLHEEAEKAGVLLVSGASSVPCLTSALIDHYKHHFATLEEVDYGITTAQKTTRGLATTAAILSYTGKPFSTLIKGATRSVYGWQSVRARRYPNLGWRLLGNCNVPDLALFPKRYPELKTIRFYAGLELPFIHLTLWGLSWLVRLGLVTQLARSAPALLKLSFLFDWLGSANSALHMTLKGITHTGDQKSLSFELTAKNGDGPYIPSMPTILLCNKFVSGELQVRGAYPCVGFIRLDEYLEALKDLDISWIER